MSTKKKGKKFTSEHKEKLSKARQERVITIETRTKTSKTSTGKINIKRYMLIDPDGKEYITNNGLNDFCRKHFLTSSNILKVISGERKHHKGWKARKL